MLRPSVNTYIRGSHKLKANGNLGDGPYGEDTGVYTLCIQGLQKEGARPSAKS